MKLKKTFKRIKEKIVKKILEILIYFEQKRIGKCEVVLDKGKIIINIYVSQKCLYDNNVYFIKPKVPNSTVNYIINDLYIYKKIKIISSDNSNVIIKNSYIDSPINFIGGKIELENNIYTKENIKDNTGTSIGGTVNHIKFKNETIYNKGLVISFKANKFELEDSKINIFDTSLDIKYIIVKNSSINLNKLEFLNNEVSYFKESNVKSNFMKTSTKKLINKKSKIKTFALDYNGKMVNTGELLRLDTTSLDSEKNLRSNLTTKLIKLKENLENSKKQILEKVCEDLEERKVKKYLKK